MACYAGTTTDPDTIRKIHKADFRDFRNWRIEKIVRSQTAAGEWEKKQMECRQHGPGSGPEKTSWYCYKFTF